VRRTIAHFLVTLVRTVIVAIAYPRWWHIARWWRFGIWEINFFQNIDKKHM